MGKGKNQDVQAQVIKIIFKRGFDCDF